MLNPCFHCCLPFNAKGWPRGLTEWISVPIQLFGHRFGKRCQPSSQATYDTIHNNNHCLMRTGQKPSLRDNGTASSYNRRNLDIEQLPLPHTSRYHANAGLPESDSLTEELSSGIPVKCCLQTASPPSRYLVCVS